MYSNPILQSKNLVLYIIFWIIVIGVYSGLLHYSQNVHPAAALADGIVFNLLLAGLGLALWYPAKFLTFESISFLNVLLRHTAAAVLFTTLWLIAGFVFINTILTPGQKYDVFFYDTLIWRFLIGILFYFLITSFYYVIIYYSGYHERNTKEAELKSLITEAELKSLKFQINPHFIFNSLNSMSALTTINPAKAREMILKLADFLRYTLANNTRQQNPLHEELKNIKLYLDIEKIRFEDKFEYVEEVQTECLETLVPNMILQPLVENAIKHAVYETLNKVTIKLSCIPEDQFLRIMISNNYDKDGKKKSGAGVGLQNIKNRLKLIYNMENLMSIENGEGVFTVSLFIPR